MKTKHILTPLVLTIALASALQAADTTIVNDTFDTVTTTGGSNQSATSGPNTYYSITSGYTFYSGGDDSTSNAGYLNYRQTSYTAAYLSFSPVTLAVGDSLSLSFQVKYPGSPVSLQYGLYNSGGNPATLEAYNATTNPQGNTAAGYYIGLNASGTNALYRSALADGTSGTTNVFNFNGGATQLKSNLAVGTFGDAWQSVSLTITRTSTGLSFSGSIAGQAFTGSDTNPLTTTFDSFVFGNRGSGTGFQIDDLKIEYLSSIPEPANVAALLGSVALIGTCAFRKRR